MYKEWKLRALTPIWTGDLQGRPTRLIPTGIVGSLRWWYEVLVRGLEGKACDPTVDDARCPDQNGRHCVVCELFGCTGWARKFRLMILDDNDQVIQNQIQPGQTFILRFISLRPIAPEEWCLLDATLRLIADYGAIGGKTVFKPSDEWGIADLGADDLDDSRGQVVVLRSRRGLPLQRNDVIEEVDGIVVAHLHDLENLLSERPHGSPLKIKVRRRNGTQEEIDSWAGKRHHQDFGLIAVEERPQGVDCTLQQVKAYVQQERWRKDFDDRAFAWASLQNFWCVKGRYLARQDRDRSSFNFIIGRPEPKNQSSQGDSWLAGRRPDQRRGIKSESKKVFSFKHLEARTFGFVKDNKELAHIREKLMVLRDGDGNRRQSDPIWQGFDPNNEFLTKERILTQLLLQEDNA